MSLPTLKTPPFWLVWSPNGDRPPSYRHPSEAAAEKEANRLADEHPGREFYVLQPTVQVVAQRRFTQRYTIDDGIPF
jgi:hypothetical protein